jgi:hypothetical protein
LPDGLPSRRHNASWSGFFGKKERDRMTKAFACATVMPLVNIPFGERFAFLASTMGFGKLNATYMFGKLSATVAPVRVALTFATQHLITGFNALILMA